MGRRHHVDPDRDGDQHGAREDHLRKVDDQRPEGVDGVLLHTHEAAIDNKKKNIYFRHNKEKATRNRFRVKAMKTNFTSETSCFSHTQGGEATRIVSRGFKRIKNENIATIKRN